MGWPERLGALLPGPVRPALRGAAVALLGVLGLAALTLLVVLVVHAGDVFSLGGRLAPGPVGGALLVLACVLTVPNAVLWSAAYLLGPGFTVGVATSVSPSGVVLGPVPAFPLLAALPSPGDAPAWAPALLVLPVLAGAVGGALAARGLPAGSWWHTAAAGAAAGGVAGVLLAGLLLVSRWRGGTGRDDSDRAGAGRRAGRDRVAGARRADRCALHPLLHPARHPARAAAGQALGPLGGCCGGLARVGRVPESFGPFGSAGPARLVVLVSGTGTNLQALLDACAEPGYGASVVGVGADRPDTGGVARAEAAGVDTFVLRVGDFADRRTGTPRSPNGSRRTRRTWSCPRDS